MLDSNFNVQYGNIRSFPGAMAATGVKTNRRVQGFESFLNMDVSGTGRDRTVVEQAPIEVGGGKTFQSFSHKARADVLYAYRKQAEANSEWQKYADDQLLGNPGGDRYYLEEKKVLDKDTVGVSFWGRISKDICDAVSNVKNCFKNIFFGAKRLYRGEENRIKETKQRGLIGSVSDCIKNLASAFSFGNWRPNGEVEPEGLAARAGFMLSKIRKALFGDVIQGVGGSTLQIGEDLLLAGWNFIETVPDATIGNFKEGRNFTTAVFDNGQVVIDYMTDIAPCGEAWLRVHACELSSMSDGKAPVLYNLKMPERYSGDVRWKYVRNTPLRKTIETIGSLVADAFTLYRLGDVRLFSENRRERN